MRWQRAVKAKLQPGDCVPSGLRNSTEVGEEAAKAAERLKQATAREYIWQISMPSIIIDISHEDVDRYSSTGSRRHFARRSVWGARSASLWLRKQNTNWLCGGNPARPDYDKDKIKEIIGVAGRALRRMPG